MSVFATIILWALTADGLEKLIIAGGDFLFKLGGTLAAIGVLWNIIQNRSQAKEAKADLKAAVKTTGDKIDVVQVIAEDTKLQTNGITERLEKSTAEKAEAVTTLEITADKLKQYDPKATVLHKANEVVAKAKSDTNLPVS